MSENLALESRRLIVGRTCARYTLAVVYLTAGIFHIWKPETFLLITPDWVPFPKDVIFGTGICEVVGAFALLTQSLRYAAGLAFALYAICVFPANIKHAFYGLPPGHPQLTWWYHAPRLAFQPVLVWWALFVGEITIWPFRKNRTPPPSITSCHISHDVDVKDLNETKNPSTAEIHGEGV